MKEDIVRVAVIGMTENKGGIESVIMNIYRNIDREKVQFDFLLLHDSVEIAFEDEILALGGRIFRIMYSQRESYIKARRKLAQYFMEHPEVRAIHVHTNYPYAFPLKIAKEAGIPVRILHAHSSVMLYERNRGIGSLFKLVRNAIAYRQVSKYPNLYFSCSDLAAEATFKRKEYIWIKNGVELEQFSYNEEIREEIRKENNINDVEIVIGVVGRICAGKNSIFTLNIFKEYLKINPNAKLVFVGDGEQRKDIEDEVKKSGLNQKVIITGIISDAYKWYQAFDVLILPSLYEGLPVVLVEGQASGLPCIASSSVTKQVKVTELLKYMSNNEPANKWALEIEKQLVKSYDRAKYKDEMKNASFDVKSMADEVVKYYTLDESSN